MFECVRGVSVISCGFVVSVCKLGDMEPRTRTKSLEQKEDAKEEPFRNLEVTSFAS